MSEQDPCAKEWEQYQEAMKELEKAKDEADSYTAREVRQGEETSLGTNIDAMRIVYKRLHEAEAKTEEKRKMWGDCKKRYGGNPK